MGVFGLALAGALALTVTVAAQADPLKSHTGPASAAPAPGVVKVWDGNRPNWHPAPNVRGGGWHQARGPGQSPQWNGEWVPRHWGPNGPPGGWGPYPRPGVPTYWVWGPS